MAYNLRLSFVRPADGVRKVFEGVALFSQTKEWYVVITDCGKSASMSTSEWKLKRARAE